MVYENEYVRMIWSIMIYTIPYKFIWRDSFCMIRSMVKYGTNNHTQCTDVNVNVKWCLEVTVCSNSTSPLYFNTLTIFQCFFMTCLFQFALVLWSTILTWIRYSNHYILWCLLFLINHAKSKQYTLLLNDIYITFIIAKYKPLINLLSEYGEYVAQ